MLTTPLIFAALSAGLLGGVHCIGMCGGITSILASVRGENQKTIPITPLQNKLLTQSNSPWRIPSFLHTGRIFTYTLMGGFTGSMGALGLHFHPLLPIHTLMYIIGNLALIWLGLRLFGYTPHFAPLDRLAAQMMTRLHLSPRNSILKQTQRYPFLVGMAWGCLPCGLIYGVLPFALLSGSAVSGAVLMLIFGAGALPHLLLAQSIAQWRHHSRVPALIRGLGATLLTGIGTLGLWGSFNMAVMPSFLCITSVH